MKRDISKEAQRICRDIHEAEARRAAEIAALDNKIETAARAKAAAQERQTAAEDPATFAQSAEEVKQQGYLQEFFTMQKTKLQGLPVIDADMCKDYKERLKCDYSITLQKNAEEVNKGIEELFALMSSIDTVSAAYVEAIRNIEGIETAKPSNVSDIVAAGNRSADLLAAMPQNNSLFREFVRFYYKEKERIAYAKQNNIILP